MRSAAVSQQPMFPTVQAGVAELETRSRIEGRARQVQRHRDSMRICWPQWNRDLTVGASIECHSCIATLAEDATLPHVQLSAGGGLYMYCAPCTIVEVVDPETFIAVVSYDAAAVKGSPWIGIYNGIKLRLDILDVWVPVRRLRGGEYSGGQAVPKRG